MWRLCQPLNEFVGIIVAALILIAIAYVAGLLAGRRQR